MKNLFVFSLTVVIGISYVQALPKNCNNPAAGSTVMDWETFKSYHGEVYDSIEEDESARLMFEGNVADLKAHNLTLRQGKMVYSTVDGENPGFWDRLMSWNLNIDFDHIRFYHLLGLVILLLLVALIHHLRKIRESGYLERNRRNSSFLATSSKYEQI